MNKIMSIIALCAVVFVSGCGGSGSNSTNGPSNSAVAPTQTPAPLTIGTATLQSGIRTLTTSEVASISITNNEDANGNSEWLVPTSMDLANGQVIMANSVPYLVISAVTQADGIHLTLGRPALSQVLSSLSAAGQIDVSDMSPNPAAGVTATNFSGTPHIYAHRSREHAAINVSPPTFTVPIHTDTLSGTLFVTLTGKVDFNANVSLLSPFAAGAQFNGNIAITGTLTATVTESPNVITYPIASPCMSFFIGEIPAGMCLPLQLVLTEQAKLAGTIPINFSQAISIGIAYPSDYASTSNQLTPDTTPLDLSNVTATQFLPCTTYTLTESAALKLMPTFSIFGVFNVAQLTGQLSYTESAQVRIDPRLKIPTPVSSIGSQLGFSVAGQVGVWGDINATAELSLTPQNPIGNIASKILTSNLSFQAIYGPIDLYSNTYQILVADPLPPCITVTPGAVTPAGESIVIQPDSNPSPDSNGITQTISVTPPGATAAITTTSPSDSTVAPIPGNYILAITDTNAGGTTTTTESWTLYPTGHYQGTYSGNGIGGTATAIIDSVGNMTAAGTSGSSTFTASGTVTALGTFTLNGGTSGGATFTGTFTPGNGGWIMSGTWSHGSYSGVFSLMQTGP